MSEINVKFPDGAVKEEENIHLHINPLFEETTYLTER